MNTTTKNTAGRAPRSSELTGISESDRSRVLVQLSEGENDPGAVLLAHLLAVEAVHGGAETAIALSKGGICLAIEGAASDIEIAGAPEVGELQRRFLELGGRYLVSSICVEVSDLGGAAWVPGVEVVGPTRVLEFAAAGATILSY